MQLSSQEGICDKNSAPSVSSISRVLRNTPRGAMSDSDHEGSLKDHSIEGILGGRFTFPFYCFTGRLQGVEWAIATLASWLPAGGVRAGARLHCQLLVLGMLVSIGARRCE